MFVFDASTLILLAKTDLLDLFLDHLKDKAFITEEVEEECCRKPQAFDSLIIQKLIEEGRITVRALKQKCLSQTPKGFGARKRRRRDARIRSDAEGSACRNR